MKEAHKEKTQIKEIAQLEVRQKETLIIEQKEQNQCGSTNIFNSNIDFKCAGTQNDFEE